ncbi:hypothetical protein HYS93_00800 [Candidatus Daviesbacteria bacterium]|nr:hypothetical protein [Candidatus Daviesbacteria bacterium]
MLICSRCGKKPNKIAFSRHQKGSSGASEWPLRAQITKHIQRPNLHIFKGQKYCTKCLRIVKKDFNIAMSKAPASLPVT